ncbi:MAG: thymidylate kinase [Clostridiales bacterium 43-6]|nr:MAG: thymidylate kinase [Clostridiales bacterium 43-6]
MSGKLIVIEGLDGSGKGTQTKLLINTLTEKNIPHKKISFPDYNDPSSTLVQMYLRGEFGEDAYAVNAYAASTFYAVDRYASFFRHWSKDYHTGKHIIADRYTTSNAVHQTVKLPKEQWDEYLDWLYDFEYDHLRIPKPDLVLYLDMPVEVSQVLLSGRYKGDESKKDIHERNTNYLSDCRAAALYAAAHLGWEVIPCAQNSIPLAMVEIAETISKKVLGII